MDAGSILSGLSTTMRKLVLGSIIVLLWMTGFSQSLSFQNDEARFLYAATNFDITWNVPSNSWPETVWVYQHERASFSNKTVDNLLSLFSLSKTDIDRHYSNGNALTFSKDGKDLRVSFVEGEITCYVNEQFGLDHLRTNVPDINGIIELTTNLLPKIGISLSELTKTADGQPKITYDPNQEGAIYFTTNRTSITNLTQRTAWFRRTIDGLKVDGSGGFGTINYGENGHVVKMLIEWQGVKRYKQFSTVTKQEILQWLRDGHCYFPHWLYPPYQDKIDIDWSTVKHLTIDNVEICYKGITFQNGQLPINSYVYPFTVLSATVDTGNTNLNIEIYCPSVKERK